MKEKVIRLLEDGNLDEAKALLDTWCEREPENWTPWILLSGIASRTDDFSLGLRSFKNLIRIRPSSAIASSGYFSCLVHADEKEFAQKEMIRFKAAANVENEMSRDVLKEQAEVLANKGWM